MLIFNAVIVLQVKKELAGIMYILVYAFLTMVLLSKDTLYNDDLHFANLRILLTLGFY